MATKKEKTQVSEPAFEEIIPVKENVLSVDKDENGSKKVIVSSDYESAREKNLRFEENLAAKTTMVNAMKRHSFVYGTINGVELLSRGKDEIMVCLVIPGEGNVKTLIPLNSFFMTFPINMDTVDLKSSEGRKDFIERQRKIADRLINASVKYFVTDIMPEDSNGIVVCLGNRVEALKSDRKHYWLEENLKAGNIYDAKCVLVSPHSVLVELGGYEKLIPEITLSNKPFSDCRELLSPGDRLPVAVTNVQFNEDGTEVSKINLDSIIAEVITHKRNLDKLNIHKGSEKGTYSSKGRLGSDTSGVAAVATITKIMKKNYVDEEGEKHTEGMFYAWVEGYDFPAKVISVPHSAIGRPLRKGDRVCVTVVGKTEFGYGLVFVRHLLASRNNSVPTAMR